jgi:hypothetical protein
MDKALFDDEKKFRKLRKVLRQIEHLKLLARELNDEEKEKVSKQKIYKKQLKDLNLKYPNNELTFRDNQNTSVELEQSNQAEEKEEEKTVNTSEIEVNLPTVIQPDIQIDELTSKLDSLNIEKSNIEEEVVEKKEAIVEPIPEPIKKVQEEITVKKPKKNLKPVVAEPKQVVCFETFEIKDAHDDLIVSLDVYSESELIVTGRLVFVYV